MGEILEEAEGEGLDVQTSRVCPNGVVAVFGPKQAQELAHGGPFRAPHHTVSAKGMADEVEKAQGGVLHLESLGRFSPTIIASLGAALQNHPNVVVAYSGTGDWNKGYVPDNPAAINKRLRLLGVSAPYGESGPEPGQLDDLRALEMEGGRLLHIINGVAQTGDEAAADAAIDDASDAVIKDAAQKAGVGSAAFGTVAQMREDLHDLAGSHYHSHSDRIGLVDIEPEEEVVAEVAVDAPPSDEAVAAELEKLLGGAKPLEEATGEAEAKAVLQPEESASEDDEVLALLGLKGIKTIRRNPRARRNPELGDATISMLTTHLTGKGHSAEDAAGVAAMVAKAVAGVEGKSATEVALLVVQNLDPLVTLYFKRKGEEAPEVEKAPVESAETFNEYVQQAGTCQVMTTPKWLWRLQTRSKDTQTGKIAESGKHSASSPLSLKT